MREPPPGFSRPDYSLPFNVEERLQGLSPSRTAKGFLLQGMINTAKEAGKPLLEDRKYIAFKDYPSTEGAQLLVEIATTLYPDLPTQEGLRRLGWKAFGFLSSSTLGRVLLGTVGLKLETLLGAVPRIFSQLLKNGSVEVELGANNARVHYKEFYPDFLDCFQLGVLEGGLKAYGKTHEVFIRQVAHGEAELWGFWD
jgi:uncharacterized protein (TIGR02265 family)